VLSTDPNIIGGNFRLVFDGDAPFSQRLTGFYARIRSIGLYYGDSYCCQDTGSRTWRSCLQRCSVRCRFRHRRTCDSVSIFRSRKRPASVGGPRVCRLSAGGGSLERTRL
jgi:hypothetical protein